MSYDLKLEHVYDAAPEAVFDAFTDPDAQQELYADAPDWIVQSECQLEVGGLWTISFGPPDQEPARETNIFTVVERPRLLVYRSTMELPGGSSLHTLVRVTFEPEDGLTRVTLVQSGFPTSERRDEFAQGWSSILQALAQSLTGS